MPTPRPGTPTRLSLESRHRYNLSRSWTRSVDVGGGDFHFGRGELARGYADALIGSSPFPQRSGLVLAAPRRTGKSTFLRRDLQPELDRRGAVTVYVDLWADRTRDPALLIVTAVAKAMSALEGPAARALRRIGVRCGSVAGFTVDRADKGTAEAGSVSL